MMETVQGATEEQMAQALEAAMNLTELQADLEALNEDAEYLPSYRVGNKVEQILRRRLVGAQIEKVLAKLHQNPPRRNGQ
jgi:hypothetical protein